MKFLNKYMDTSPLSKNEIIDAIVLALQLSIFLITISFFCAIWLVFSGGII